MAGGVVAVKFLGDAKNLNKTLGQVESGMGRVGSKFASFGRFAAKSFAALGVAAGAGAVAGATFGIKTAASMEQAEIAFTTMLGSAEKANAFLQKMRDFAATTPFEFPELQTAASSLVSAGIEADKVIPIMKTLGDVTSGMGTGSEGVRRATVALQQMAAAGRITGEDLNQLRDAGIPVYDLLAAATKKSKAEVVKLAQAGKLGTNELGAMMKALETGAGLERFSGLMDKQSRSLSGLWSTFKDTLGMGLANLLTPAIPALKAGLNTVSTAMGDFFGGLSGNVEIMDQSARPKLELFGLGLRAVGAAFKDGDVTSDGFVGAMERVGVAARKVADFVQAKVVPALKDIGRFVVQNVVPAAGQLARFFVDRLVPAFRSASEFVAKNVIPVVVGLARFFVDHMLPAITKIAAAILGGLKSAFDTIGKKIQENRPQLDALFRVFSAIAGFVVRTLAPVLAVVLRAAFSTLGHMIGGAITVIGALVRMFEGVARAVGWVVDKIKQLISWMKKIPSKIPGLSAVTSAVGKVGGAVGGAVGKIPGFAHGVTNFSGGLAVVGEHGAELVNLPRGSDVIPNHALGRGGTTIINNFNIAGSVLTERELGEVVREQFLRVGRRNGSALGSYA